MTRGEQARSEILDAAERLIAERGVCVPLRDIAVAAGQRNNSAVNYHFRNRQELIDAVVRRRLVPMEQRRRLMLTSVPVRARADVWVLLRIMVLPLLEVDSSHYARFLQATALHLSNDSRHTQGLVWPEVMKALARAVPTSNRRVRRARVGAVATAMFALLADHERRCHGQVVEAEAAEEIIAMLAAMLTAPCEIRATTGSQNSACGT